MNRAEFAAKWSRADLSSARRRSSTSSTCAIRATSPISSTARSSRSSPKTSDCCPTSSSRGFSRRAGAIPPVPAAHPHAVRRDGRRRLLRRRADPPLQRKPVRGRPRARADRRRDPRPLRGRPARLERRRPVDLRHPVRDGPWKRYVHDSDDRGIGTVRYPRIVARGRRVRRPAQAPHADQPLTTSAPPGSTSSTASSTRPSSPPPAGTPASPTRRSSRGSSPSTSSGPPGSVPSSAPSRENGVRGMTLGPSSESKPSYGRQTDSRDGAPLAGPLYWKVRPDATSRHFTRPIPRA